MTDGEREWVPAPRPPLGDPQPDGSWRVHAASLDGYIFICAARCLGCGLDLTPLQVRGFWLSPEFLPHAENVWPVPMEADYLRTRQPRHPEVRGGCGGRIAFSQCPGPPEEALARYEQQVTERRAMEQQRR